MEEKNHYCVGCEKFFTYEGFKNHKCKRKSNQKFLQKLYKKLEKKKSGRYIGVDL